VGTLAIRYMDLVALALALPIFIAGGLSLTGYAIAGGAWLAQRGLQALLQRKVDSQEDARQVVGLLMGGSFARAVLTAAAVLIAGLAGGDEAGLAAALMVVALFTVYFISRLLDGGLAPE